jgi:hypothetical protein
MDTSQNSNNITGLDSNKLNKHNNNNKLFDKTLTSDQAIGSPLPIVSQNDKDKDLSFKEDNNNIESMMMLNKTGR